MALYTVDSSFGRGRAMRPNGPHFLNRSSRHGVPNLFVDVTDSTMRDLCGRVTVDSVSNNAKIVGGRLGGQVLNCSGTNQYAYVEPSGATKWPAQSVNWTVDCWFYWTTATDFSALFEQVIGVTRIVCVFLRSSGATAYISIRYGGTSEEASYGTTPFSTGVLQHFALTRLNNAIALYRNGVPEATWMIGGSTVANDGNMELYLGEGASGGADFAGQYACWRQWNHAKSPGQIAELYHSDTRWDLYAQTSRRVSFSVSTVTGNRRRRVLIGASA